MPLKKITIPITDHASNCTNYYLVEWKLSSESGYNSTTWPNDQIVISNLQDASVYDVRITRYCCNGGTSAPLILSVDTTTDSPQLTTPNNFELRPDSPPVSGQLVSTWDTVADAEEYIVQVAQDDDFTVGMVEAIVTDPTITYTFTGLDGGEVYYGRVKARASGYADSDWSATDSATAPA